MCTLFVNLYVLLMWGPHMVYMGTPYIFDIYLIRCGWLGWCAFSLTSDEIYTYLLGLLSECIGAHSSATCLVYTAITPAVLSFMPAVRMRLFIHTSSRKFRR